METKIIHLLTYTSLILIISCSTYKKTDNKSANLITPTQNTINKWSSLQIDSIYEFECNGKHFSIKGNTISRPYFDINLRKCLMQQGFNGDIEANAQLAKLIRMLRIDKFNIFGRQPKFRGPEVFEAFLDISSDDFSPSVDFDGNKSEITSNSQAFAHYYLEMLLTIEGLSFNEYGNKIYKNHTFVHPEFIEGEGINYNHYLEFWKLVLNGIKEAWKNNLIVLKPYGQE